jgi:molybdopterin molybdotransferase
LRATLRRDPGGQLVATPFPTQDSSMVGVLAEANCLVVRDPYAPAAEAGTACTIVRIPD